MDFISLKLFNVDSKEKWKMQKKTIPDEDNRLNRAMSLGVIVKPTT
jgi:hypothetical protein